MESEFENQACCRGCVGSVCTSTSLQLPSSVGNQDTGGYFLTNKHHLIEYPESLLQLLGSETMDSYTAGIELSNACREFYVKRQKDAESLKSKLRTTTSNGEDSSSITADNIVHGRSHKSAKTSDKNGTGTPASLQAKMDILKEQLSSLVDQDLLLMKQFLTLNERIEELKWQRKMESYQLDHSADSTLSTASSSLRRSVLRTHKASASTACPRLMSTEFLDLKYPTPSELSLFNECSTETLGPSTGEMSLKKGKKLMGSENNDSEHKDIAEEFEEQKWSASYTNRTSTLDKFMFKTTASVRHSDCSNHKDVVGHCVHCPRNLMNLGQVKGKGSSGVMFSRADSGHFTEESKCSTLSSTYTDSSDRQHENTSFDSGISDQENQTEFVVEV